MNRCAAPVLAFIFCAAATASLKGQEARPEALYVSPTGTGSTCTRAEPCALEQVQDALRQRNANLQADLTVYLRGGTYRLARPWELTAADSGSNGFYVAFVNHPGETPEISGGRVVGGWTLHDAAKNIYRAPAPPGLATRQLYVDDVRAQRARGHFDDDSFVETATGYTAANGPTATWKNISSIEVVDLVQWKAFRCPLAAVAGKRITMAEPCWTNSQWHEPYDLGPPSWLENALELLDLPGEWYHDRSGG